MTHISQSLDAFFITVCHDAVAEIGDCIESVKGQTYPHWQMCVMVDGRNEATVRAAWLAAGEDPRIHIVPVSGRRYGLRNMVEGIHRYCPHNSIVCVLDGDDCLADESVLDHVMQEFYADEELDALWTQHLHTEDRRNGNSGELKGDPIFAPWTMSAMKVFRKRLIWATPPDLYRDDTGEWFHSATDQALFRPILAAARKSKFLNRVCYLHNWHGGDDRIKDQNAQEAIQRKQLKTRYPYERRNVLLVVNGPAETRRTLCSMGERRPPLGILIMSAHLKARGHVVTICDRFAEPKAFPNLDILKKTDVLGFYVSSPNAADVLPFIRKAKGLGFTGRIIAGGPHAVLHGEEIRSWGVDHVCRDEADFHISAIVEDRPYEGHRVLELDLIPPPAYELIDLSKYTLGWVFDDTTPVLTLNTSRGCPYRCKFCDSWRLWGQGRYEQSPERILCDVEYLAAEFGAKGIYFREDNLATNVSRLMEISAVMGETGLKWACEVRANLAAVKYAAKGMAAGGCCGWYIGAESGSATVLTAMRKGITPAQIEAAMDNANQLGIKVAMSIVEGFPEETTADRAATESMIVRTKPHVVWRNKYRKPGVYE